MKDVIKPTMLLINGVWQNKPTFNLIPITLDAPYTECIFDVDSKTLAVISKTPKQSFHMLPKYDDNGDVQMIKVGKRQNGKQYKEERKAIDTFQEYYVLNPKDIETIINMVAFNADTFDYKVFMTAAPAPKISNIETSDKSIVTAPAIEIVAR